MVSDSRGSDVTVAKKLARNLRRRQRYANLSLHEKEYLLSKRRKANANKKGKKKVQLELSSSFMEIQQRCDDHFQPIHDYVAGQQKGSSFFSLFFHLFIHLVFYLCLFFIILNFLLWYFIIIF